MRTNEQPEGLTLPATITTDPEVERELRTVAWEFVTAGRDDLDGYVDWVTDDDAASEEQAEAAFAFVRAARVAQQADWSDEPSALDRAFAGLEEIGILARQNFTCCGTCGSAEIGDERDDSRAWRGYVYFHSQDTDSLIESRATYVGYGTFLDAWLPEAEWDAMSGEEKDRYYTETTQGLMAEAQRVVEGEGLSWEWDGQLSRRILIGNADYFVRLAP